METLNKFIARRKAEIAEEMEGLRTELRQISAAEAMAQSEANLQAARRREQTPETIKEQVVKILVDCPSGLNAKEIQAQLKSRFDRDVKRESLSPQLSRLGAEGVIKRDGKIWALPMVETALERFRFNYRARLEDSKFVETAASKSKSEGNDATTENPQELHS